MSTEMRGRVVWCIFFVFVLGGCCYLHGHGASHFPAAARVVHPTHEGPQELNSPREQLAEVRQEDQEHWDAEDGVDDGDGASCRGGGRNVAVA